MLSVDTCSNGDGEHFASAELSGHLTLFLFSHQTTTFLGQFFQDNKRHEKYEEPKCAGGRVIPS